MMMMMMMTMRWLHLMILTKSPGLSARVSAPQLSMHLSEWVFNSTWLEPSDPASF